ncbi:acetamidase/formamidase family protein [Desulfosarcina ovata]|uniref:Acetamidase n=1 Tax=Desulfosarcina ovata subsp. ovata TaxID=2752305 RepID=A0A5K8AAP9_9BACT|nr:acetamidase/formamidase family protein [Desulfosarcina ovata]BBO89712.1 acetamidase [Desulfosarcina ovata subsp. ovata]
MNQNRHAVGRAQAHFGWNHQLTPVLHVAPGDIVTFDTIDAGGGQLNRNSTVDDIGRFEFDRINPTFGPVYVDGAEPGDALEVTVLNLEIADWGWTANIPGFGLLAERFTDPALHIWKLDPVGLAPAEFKAGARVPLRPFPGIMGNALPEAGTHSVVNPRRFGGNMDTRDIGEGSRLLLPVGVPGALFSCGDGHAAQGDGEICGTAIETPMRMTLKLDLVKRANLNFPRFTTSGPVSNHFDPGGYEVCMAMGGDLMTSAKNAVSDMVDWVAATYQMADVEAYLLLSVCADLRINEIVDTPDWVVSCYLPKIVFQR